MSLENMEISRSWHAEIISLAEKIFIADLTIPNPEGGLQGTHEDSDFVADPGGGFYKDQKGKWLHVTSFAKDKVNREWPLDPSTDIRGPVWHRDEYGWERRRIRECLRQAKLFYSTLSLIHI